MKIGHRQMMGSRHFLFRILKRIPLTVFLIGGVLTVSSVAGLFTHVIAPDQLQHWGFGWEDLSKGRLGRLLLVPFLVLRPYMILTISAILLFFVGTCEMLWRTRRTLIAFMASHVMGYIGALSILQILGHAGWASAAQLAAERDVGASNGAFGAAGALVIALPQRLRMTSILVLSTYLFASLVVEQQIWDVQHLIAFGTGLLFGALFRRHDRGLLPELRPVADILHRQRPRLMSWLVGSMGVVNLLAAILLPRHAGFERLESLLPLGLSHASRMLLLFSGLTLLVLASALRQAQRFAWWIALVTLLATLLLHLQLGISRIEALFAVTFLFLLVAWKEDFPAPIDRPSLSDSRAMVIAGTVITPLLSWLALISLRDEYEGYEPGISSLMHVLGRLLYLAPSPLVPLTRRADWLLEAIPLVFWTCMILALSIALRVKRAPKAHLHERSRARQLVMEHGSTSTAFMTTWAGNSFFFVPGGDAFLAYRLYGGVAVVLGDPIGPMSLQALTIDAFLKHCRELGWAPTFLAATEPQRQAYEGTGFRLLKVGEEAVIPLPGLEFKGKDWQNMRSALNRAQREGLRFKLYEGGRVPAELEEQMRQMNQEWLGDQELPPMEFILGSVEDIRDPEVEVAVAVDAAGILHGFVDWLPVPARQGWVIDLMRRRKHCMSGTMEYLIGMSLLAFQQRGERFASLATAPLADVDRDTGMDLLPRILGTIFTRFDMFYDFKSLFDFKDRFQPRWEPVYLAYLDPLDLPRIAFAVMRAQLPRVGIADLARLVGDELAGRLRAQIRLEQPARAVEPPQSPPR